MSHRHQAARMERERSYKPIEKTYFTESEYQAYLALQKEHSYNTPEMEAVLKKIHNRNPAGFELKKDRRILQHFYDMRTSIALPPRAPEARYPRSTDVSAHKHIVQQTDSGKIYASDYFRGTRDEYDLSFVALQRRVDKTPLTPILGQNEAIFQSIRTQESIFAGTQLAFQGNMPGANRFVRVSE